LTEKEKRNQLEGLMEDLLWDWLCALEWALGPGVFVVR